MLRRPARVCPRTTSKPTNGLTWQLHELKVKWLRDYRLLRDELAEKMPASQIAEAQRLAREWQLKNWEQLKDK